MALVVKDRVRVTTTTTGTSDFSLGSAVTGYQSFSVIGNNNTTYYVAVDPSTGDWEVGVGTFLSAGPTLTRDTILESSNAGSKVVFAAGAKDVFVSYPAERAVYLNAAGLAVDVLDIGTLGTSTANISNANITAGTVATTPTSATDIANKSYVDTIASSGITYHTPVKYEVPNTTGNLNATYNNGVSGVGATLTNAGTKAAFAPDGPTAQVGDRILVYNQTNAFENGIYEVTTVGTPDPGGTNWVLTRTSDANSYGVKDPNKLGNGDAFFITSGNTGAGETYVCNTVGTITFGTTAITFVQVSDATLYTAGTGLTLSGTQFSITPVGTAGTYGSASQVPVIVTNASGQVSGVTNTAIAITSGAVSGLAASATTDTTNAANITSGTLPIARLSGSYTGISGVGTLTVGTWNAGTIGVSYGGTGFASYAVGDLLYADTTTSLAKLADVVVGNALISGGVGTAPSWGKIGLTTHVSGTLGVANGGTGAATLTGYVYGNGTGAFTASTSIPNSATTATSANTANAIVARDASGNFSAGTITAALSGNASTATSATTATNLAGGSVGTIPYQTAAATTAMLAVGTSGQYLKSNGAAAPSWDNLPAVNNGTLTMAVSGTGLSGSATFTANQAGNSTFTVTSNATSSNTFSTIVARDTSGNFSAGTITASLSGNATSATTSTNLAGGSAGTVPYQSAAGTTAMLAAGTAGQYLQSNGAAAPSWQTFPTIGNGTLTMNVSGNGLSGSQTFTANQSSNATYTVTSNATSANTASTIVFRDGSGNFSAGTITANLTGTATNADAVNSISAVNLYNNMGQLHGTRTAFDATTPSYGFGYRFVQGNANGPGTGGTQFYSWYIGLGSDYPATGGGSYGAMFAVDRNSSTPYLSVRFNESNSFTGWYKIRAGYADSAGNVNNGTLTMNVSGTGLSGSATFTANQAGNSTFTVTSNATDLNTASTIVARNASGNFAAGTITASLSGNATTATTATNLAGGSAGTVPYQSAAGTTAMLAAGTAGYYLQANGAAAPSWVAPPTIGNGTLTLAVSGNGLSGSASFTANQSGGSTFTVTSNATAANTASTIAYRDTSSGFAIGYLNNNTWYTYNDNDRNAGSATYYPNAATRAVRYFFANSSSTGTGGNYAGVLQFNPWDGTTASTGDASYQLAFGSTADNGGGIPQLNIRKGIDITWNSWYTILHSGNYNSYSPTLTGTGASGTWGINITGNAATATTASNVNNGTLTMNVSGNGLSGSQTFTANQSTAATFTVTSNATSANTASTIVFRDASGNFSANAVTTASDSTISTLTIGRGAGSVASNTAIGVSALSTNTTGSNNTAVGNGALISNTTTVDSTAIGDNAMYYMRGNSNTAVGRQAMFGSLTPANNTGANNVAVGYLAARTITSGNYNVALGVNSLRNVTTGTYNVGVGAETLYNLSSQLHNVAVGFQTLYYMGGTANIGIGYLAMTGSTTPANNFGSYNIALGQEALAKVTSGSYNIAIGYQALDANTTASSNVAIGTSTLGLAITATQNVAVGSSALAATTGSQNTAIGESAGISISTGSKNTIIGRYTGNQGGLNISTLSNYIVLSDGDGNPRGYFDNNGNYIVGADIRSTSQNGGQMSGLRNMVSNGGMFIDQRNNGAAVVYTAATQTYVVDRFGCFGTLAGRFTIQRNQGSVTPPAGFSSYLGVTSSAATVPGATDLYALFHKIEGVNFSRASFGTANAQSIVLSFWVRSSLTGTFGGGLFNAAANRNYVFSYSISTANTWERKSITITGDTTGTWLSDNGAGLQIWWDLGAGSSNRGTAGSWTASVFYGPTGSTNVVGTTGATFYITGVQIEVGTAVTPFEHRDFATEFAMCQRYYEVGGDISLWSGYAVNGSTYYSLCRFATRKRANPTVTSTYVAAAGFPATAPATLANRADQFWASAVCNATSNGGYFQFSWVASAEL